MKIDRRSFLSLGVGAVAGLTLSPLPWKMMDDSSIWTQMWPWTPVPEDGEVSYVNSTCTLCPGGCGILVRKVNERAVKIEGLKGHPVNDGGICILGLSGLQLLYGPTRVKTPLKRVGKRGEGRWEKISWDKAISEVAEKLKNLRKENKPHTVGCISGSANGTLPKLIERFLTVYGSPNFMKIPSIQDSYELTLHLTQGVQALAGVDIENSDFVLSFGSGIIDGWGSPVRMFKANSALKKSGGRLVQIEPRLSNTAAKADRWIPINPGTEAALALGLAHVIVKKSLYHKDFIENYASGFYDKTGDNGFKRFVLDECGLDKISKITGVDKTVMETLAKNFAKAKKPIAISGRGQGKSPGSLNEFMAVHALNALVGNINKKGGISAVPEPDFINWPELEMDAIAAKGMQKERLDGAGSNKFPDTGSLLNRFAQSINSGETGKKYPMEVLFVAGANPCYTMPDTKTTKKAFGKIPFVVSFSPYMDETAQNADLILPNHTCLERYEDMPAPVGLTKPVICLSKPVVSPLFDTKQTGDVIIALAKALSGNISKAFVWDSYKTCLEKTLGSKWDVLVEDGIWVDNDFTAPAWENAFDTPSAKFEFYALKTDDINPVKIEGDDNSYPLVLMPYDSVRLANGFIGDPPFVVKTVSDTVLKGKDSFVEINPETAKSCGLSQGNYAVLSTPKGTAMVKINLFEGIMPGIIALPRGLGHTAYDKYLANKGLNVNDLIGPVEDSVSGLDTAWGIRAKLSKA